MKSTVALGALIVVVVNSSHAVAAKQVPTAHSSSIEQNSVAPQRILIDNGISCYEHKKYSEALRCFSQASKSGTLNYELVHGIVQTNVALRNYDAAFKSVNAAVSAYPNSAKYRCLRALIFDALMKDKEVLAESQEAIKLDDRCVEAYEWCGLAHANLGNFQAAVDAYTKAIELGSHRYDQRARIFGALQKPQDSYRDWNKAIMLEPNESVLYEGRGSTLAQFHKDAEAIADFSKSIYLCPEESWAYYYRAISYRKLGELDKAVHDLSLAIALNPRNADAFYWRANCYGDKKLFDAQIADCERAIALSPRPEYFHSCGRAFGQKKIYHKQILNCLESIRRDYRYGPAYAGLGLGIEGLIGQTIVALIKQRVPFLFKN